MNMAITICFALIYHTMTIWTVRHVQLSTKKLCQCGLVVAMTLVLECIQFPLPTGASISLCSPVPLMLLAILTDFRLAILGGWLCGILSIFLVPGWQLVHWGQFFVEQMACFSCLGYAGIWGADRRYKIIGGMVLASCIKIAGHIFSGVMFFSQNAWDGWGAWEYSLTYNLSQNVPLCILSAILILLLPLNALKQAADRR